MTDITVAQAAIIEDHVWALMEALGVRDSRKINRRISEAIGTVLDRQRDALPVAACTGALKIRGEILSCTVARPHGPLECSFWEQANAVSDDPEGLAQLRAWYTGEGTEKIRWVDKQQVTR